MNEFDSQRLEIHKDLQENIYYLENYRITF